MRHRMRIVLVDQSAAVRADLAKWLRFYNTVEILAEFDDINEANAYILSNAVDVVFIQFSAGKESVDGSFLACNLSMEKPDVLTVLYDADERLAYKALTDGALDFLKLPFEANELQRVVRKLNNIFTLQEYKRSMTDSDIMVKTKDGYKVVQLSMILFIERINRKIRIVCRGNEEVIISNYTMNDLEQILNGTRFYRCYQSIIVNLDNVTSIKMDPNTNSYSVVLFGYDKEVALSRQKHSEMVELLQDRCSSIRL